MSDLNFSVESQKGQFLHSGDVFKVNVSADSGNMAEISRVELYIYGRYLNGVLQDNNERLVISRSYSTPVSSLNNVFTSVLSLDSAGQFRNMKAVVTFSDATRVIKKFTNSSANAFLYCMLSSDEKPDSADLGFKNKALEISFDSPACLAASDYTLTLNVEMPSVCENLDNVGLSHSVIKNYKNNFTVKGKFVFFRNEHHSHSFDCDLLNFCSELDHSCAVETHNFGSGTKLYIVYSSGKSYAILPDSNVQCEHSETEIVFYDEVGDYDEYDNNDCGKCRNKMSQSVSCFGGIYKSLTLE